VVSSGLISPAALRAHICNVMTKVALNSSLSLQPQAREQRQTVIFEIMDEAMEQFAFTEDLMESIRGVALRHQARAAELSNIEDEDYVQAVQDVVHLLRELEL